jgi:hypothetical protein
MSGNVVSERPQCVQPQVSGYPQLACQPRAHKRVCTPASEASRFSLADPARRATRRGVDGARRAERDVVPFLMRARRRMPCGRPLTPQVQRTLHRLRLRVATMLQAHLPCSAASAAWVGAPRFRAPKSWPARVRRQERAPFGACPRPHASAGSRLPRRCAPAEGRMHAQPPGDPPHGDAADSEPRHTLARRLRAIRCRPQMPAAE